MEKRILSASFLVMLFLFAINPSFSQKECKVLMPQIEGEYTGKCKNGVAHGKGLAIGEDTYKGSFKVGLPFGKGEYKWSTGERYVGEWEFGKREGEGIFYYFKDNEPLTLEGIWIDDQYVGPAPENPKVTAKTGIERYRFQRQGDGDRVQVSFFINGISNVDFEEFTFHGSSGSQFKTGNTMGYESVIFPFICRITYYSWNKAHTSRNFTRFEFEISQPGKWQVVLHNN